MIFNSTQWNGQAAFIKVDNKLVWLEHHDWNDYEQANDSVYITPISLIVKHTDTKAKIEVGATFTSSQEILKFDDLTIAIKE